VKKVTTKHRISYNNVEDAQQKLIDANDYAVSFITFKNSYKISKYLHLSTSLCFVDSSILLLLKVIITISILRISTSSMNAHVLL